MSTTQTTPLAVNSFIWVDLVTPDAAASQAFYSELFGWKTQEFPSPVGTYTMFTKDGSNAAGMMPDPSVQGPPQWVSYVYVESAEKSLAKATELGAKVVAPMSEMGGMGRMAALQDPTGVAFRLWQPFQQPGGVNYNQPGNLCWNELMTLDTDASAAFYSKLFGWVGKTADMGPVPYTTFESAGRPAGGMLKMPDEAVRMGATPKWLVYFAVGDCDGAIASIVAKGGRLVQPAMAVPDIGRFAVLLDPQGAAFAIIQR